MTLSGTFAGLGSSSGDGARGASIFAPPAGAPAGPWDAWRPMAPPPMQQAPLPVQQQEAERSPLLQPALQPTAAGLSDVRLGPGGSCAGPGHGVLRGVQGFVATEVHLGGWSAYGQDAGLSSDECRSLLAEVWQHAPQLHGEVIERDDLQLWPGNRRITLKIKDPSSERNWRLRNALAQTIAAHSSIRRDGKLVTVSLEASPQERQTRSLIAQNCEAVSRLIRADVRDHMKPDCNLMAVRVDTVAISQVKRGCWTWMPHAIQGVDPGIDVHALAAGTLELP